jgi:hypothetical protein
MHYDPVKHSNTEEDQCPLTDEEITRFGFIRGVPRAAFTATNRDGVVFKDACHGCVLEGTCNKGLLNGLSCTNAGLWEATYKSNFKELIKYLNMRKNIKTLHS